MWTRPTSFAWNGCAGRGGWDAGELDRREKSQIALDKKRELAQYRVVNTADAVSTRRQVEAVLSRILVHKLECGPSQEGAVLSPSVPRGKLPL